MSFHPDKCKTLWVTGKKNTLVSQYQLHGHTLKNIKEIKYLGVGVIIFKDLCWASHIMNMVNKASKTLGFLGRILKIWSICTKDKAYKALVRPVLNTPAVSGTHILQEHQQNWGCATKGSTLGGQPPSTDLQCRWNIWPAEVVPIGPLDKRRWRACLIIFLKFHPGEVVINTTRKPVPSPPSRSTHSTDAEAFLLPACRTQYRQKSFFQWTIVEWNALPPVAVQSATVEAFKNQI